LANTTDVTNKALCSLWNFTHCPIDKDYCNPFVVGDKLYFQYKLGLSLGITTISLLHPTLINIETGEEISCVDCFTVEYGTDKNDTKYANLVIDTTNFTNIKCFYIKLDAFNCALQESEFNEYLNCVSDLIEEGETIQEASFACIKNYCDPIIFYAEPFCKEECLDTILIEGFYPNYDCAGYFYGTFQPNPFNGVTPPNNHKLQIRIHGEVNPNNYDIEEVRTSNSRKSAKMYRSYNLLSKQIPFYVADQIANIFASKYLMIDGIVYSKALSLPKGLEDGRMWAIDTTIQRECSDIDFTCES
jgi:hypothetical protein